MNIFKLWSASFGMSRALFTMAFYSLPPFLFALLRTLMLIGLDALALGVPFLVTPSISVTTLFLGVLKSNLRYLTLAVNLSIMPLLQQFPRFFWLDHLLRDLHIHSTDWPLFLYDNKSAIFLSYHIVFHKHSKHINLDYHFFHELVVTGCIRIQHVPFTLQVVNVYTKSVSRPLFTFFRSKLCMCSNSMLSLGGVADSPESPFDS